MDEKIKKCCGTCAHCEDNYCLGYGLGCEVYCSRLFADKSDCKHYCPGFESIEELKAAWPEEADQHMLLIEE